MVLEDVIFTYKAEFDSTNGIEKTDRAISAKIGNMKCLTLSEQAAKRSIEKSTPISLGLPTCKVPLHIELTHRMY